MDGNESLKEPTTIMSVDSASADPTYPTRPCPKRRRGRPPKYLEVWNRIIRYELAKEEKEAAQSMTANSDCSNSVNKNYSQVEGKVENENENSNTGPPSSPPPSPPPPPAPKNEQILTLLNNKRKRKLPIPAAAELAGRQEPVASSETKMFRKFYESGGRDYNDYLWWSFHQNPTFRWYTMPTWIAPTPAQSFNAVPPLPATETVLDLSRKAHSPRRTEQHERCAKGDFTPKAKEVCKWSGEDVVAFVSGIEGCAEYAEVFRLHGIDGTLLPHLSEEHLLKVFGMKLGPAMRLRLAMISLRSA